LASGKLLFNPSSFLIIATRAGPTFGFTAARATSD
jgi:hypothetical protein